MKQKWQETFVFTQQSISTFDHCPLKFKKKYIEKLKWESPMGEKEKKRLETGRAFHLLAQRYFMGLEIGVPESREDFKELTEWMKNLKQQFPLSPRNQYLPEYKLRIHNEVRLEANLDLILVNEDKIQIWDWKTHGRKSEKNKLLGKKLKESNQTLVYLYMLKENQKLILGENGHKKEIAMYYWQPDPIEILAEIHYDEELHEQFRGRLNSKLKNITEYEYSQFDKENFKSHCEFCEFNWVCNLKPIAFDSLVEENEASSEAEEIYPL